MVKSPSPEIFKNCADTVMGNVLQAALFEQQNWTRLPPKAASSLNHFEILYESVIFWTLFTLVTDMFDIVKMSILIISCIY